MFARTLSASMLLLAASPFVSAQDATPVPKNDTTAATGSAAVSAPTPVAVAPRAPAAVAAPAQRLRATLIRHVAAGKQPTTAAIVDGGATLLVTNRGDNTVSVFDTATMELSRTITDVGYSSARPAVASPNLSSFTPIRSMSDRWRLHAFR